MATSPAQVCFTPIGRVISQVKERRQAPHQGPETGQEAAIEIDEPWAAGLTDMEPGAYLWVLCHFHQADPNRLMVHPRGDPSRPKRGVFTTRSPSRPNPISLTLVQLTALEGRIVRVKGLEALDGTPVLDIKPYIHRLDTPPDLRGAP